MNTPKSSSALDSPSKKVKSTSKKRIPPDWFHELDLLRRIIAGSEVVNKPEKTSFSVKPLPLPDLRLATVSTNISLADLSETEKHGYKIYTVTRQSIRRRLRKEFLAHLKKAAEAGAKLICFNELAYPTPVDDKEDQPFREAISELVAKHRLFLVAGSYHDPRRYYNICLVFSPIPEHGDRGSGPSVHEHAKLTSAVRIEEIIRIPSNRNLRYYETEFGSFSVLVCLDAYDPALVLRLMKMNYAFNREEKIEVIFVPSFSIEKAHSLARSCADLSYATASLVVFVNCRESEPRHAVYLAGRELPFSKSNAPTYRHRSRRISSHVHVHETTYDSYHESRIDRTDAYNPVFEYLIGQKRGLRSDIKT